MITNAGLAVLVLGTQHDMSLGDAAMVCCECIRLLYCTHKKCMKENDEKSKKPIKAKSEKLMQCLKKGKTAIIFGKGFFFITCHCFKCLCKTQTRLTFFFKGPSERFKCFRNVIISQKDSSF